MTDKILSDKDCKTIRDAITNPDTFKDKHTNLPKVEGRIYSGTLEFFEQRALLALQRNENQISPDTATRSILCDAVRLGREYADVKGRVNDR